MNLSIKNVPEPVVKRLRERATRLHRSLQGELLHIIEIAAAEGAPGDVAGVVAEVRRLGLTTASDSVAIVRAARDGC